MLFLNHLWLTCILSYLKKTLLSVWKIFLKLKASFANIPVVILGKICTIATNVRKTAIMPKAYITRFMTETRPLWKKKHIQVLVVHLLFYLFFSFAFIDVCIRFIKAKNAVLPNSALIKKPCRCRKSEKKKMSEILNRSSNILGERKKS